MTSTTNRLSNASHLRRFLLCAFAAAIMLTCVSVRDASARKHPNPMHTNNTAAMEPYAGRVDYGASYYSSGFHDPSRAMGHQNMGAQPSYGPGFAVTAPMKTGVGRQSVPADFEKDGPNHLRQQSRSERLPAPIRPYHPTGY